MADISGVYVGVVKTQRDCFECGTMMNLKVLRTPAGYYLGFWCDNHGPFSRETQYFHKESEAKNLLDKIIEATGEAINSTTQKAK